MSEAKVKSKKAKVKIRLERCGFRMKFIFSLCFCVSAVNFFFPLSARAQSGGTFAVAQSVVAGGGQTSAGGGFRVDGAIGQAVAGTNSAGGNFSVRGGFRGAQFTPTAAQISLSGRVFSGKGLGIIRRVRISLLDTTTGIERVVQTNQIGFYRFDELEVGRFYIVRAQSNNYAFAPDNYFLELLEDREDVNFTGSRKTQN